MPELVQKFVWVVVCKPILVFYFGPNLAFGLGLRLGPSQTKCENVSLFDSWTAEEFDAILNFDCIVF
jgi:hypothetical protein